MKLLPTEKIWTGDKLGDVAAVTLTQLKRTPPDAKHTAALYKRTTKNGRDDGYEVFIINVVNGGTPLPGGGVVEESYEQYPTSNRFGRVAWSPLSLERAEQIYSDLIKGNKPCNVPNEVDETSEQGNSIPVVRVTSVDSLNLPDTEFSTKELAEKNGVGYPVAFIFLKQAIAMKMVKFSREERRNVKGKPTKLYVKTN